MANPVKDKSCVRKEKKILLNGLSEDYRREASGRIIRSLTDMELWRKAQIICLYYSHGNEVETTALLEDEAYKDKTFLLPKVVSDTELLFTRFTSLRDMTPGAFGIMEPGEVREDGTIFRPDIVITPCVAVSRDGSRIGHGRGYYDRYFATLTASGVKKICLAYECQLTGDFHTDDTDVKMDIIITEREIIRV